MMQTTGREWQRWTANAFWLALAVCAPALGADLTSSSAPTSASGPASAPADPLAAALAQASDRLELQRIAGDAQAPAVLAVLNQTLPALDAADGALADQAAQLQLAAGKPGVGAPAVLAQQRLALQWRRCEIALLRADLHRRAGAALAQTQPDRAALLDKSIQLYRSLRLDFADVPVSLMGYVGEARCQRLAGNAQAASAALNDVLSAPGNPLDKSLIEARRAARLESLEILLLSDPLKAGADAVAWSGSTEIKGDALWLARVNWLATRAELAGLTPAGAIPADVAQRLASRLRDPGMVAVAPIYDRLGALAKLDGRPGGVPLTRSELLQWANLLAAAGRTEAPASYQRAMALPGEPLTAAQMLAHVQLLAKDKQYQAGADACDQFLQQLGPAHPQRAEFVQLRAACLVMLLASSPDSKLAEPLQVRLLESLLTVVDETAVPQAARREALQQWVGVQGRRQGLGSAIPMIAAHRDLVEGDGFLLYAFAAGQWQLLSNKADREGRENLSGQTQSLLAELDKARAAAEAAKDDVLRAREALLRATILSNPPARDIQAALRVVNDHWDLLRAQPDTAGQASWLRVQLMMELGLTDEATKALSEMPGAADQMPAMMPLQLAEAIAQRYASVPASRRQAMQEQVIKLASQAVSRAVSDGPTYKLVTLRAARAMVDAQAFSMADPLLRELLKSPAMQTDRSATLEASLLLFQALQGSGQMAQASQYVDELVKQMPQSSQVFQAQGQCRLALRKFAQAADSFRQARKLSKAGGVEWCRATLLLAESLQMDGHAAAAADILRISHALYPSFGNPDLLARLTQMQDALQPTTRPATPIDPDQAH